MLDGLVLRLMLEYKQIQRSEYYTLVILLWIAIFYLAVL